MKQHGDILTPLYLRITRYAAATSLTLVALLSGCNSGDGSSSSNSPEAMQQAALPSIVAHAAKPKAKLAVYFGKMGSAGYANGTGTAAQFNFPVDVAVDSVGNVYTTETGNNTVRMISPTGVTTLLAGVPGVGGYLDGPLANALFNNPQGLAVDTMGNVYVSDVGNNVIRKISPSTGMVSTFAGTFGSPQGDIDGTGPAASFTSLFSMAIDPANNLFVSDGGNIRKITPQAVVTTLNFTAPNGFYPLAVAVDAADNVYMSGGDNTIDMVSPAGVFSVIAGASGIAGNSDGVGTAATFESVCGIAVDNQGHIFLTDSNDDARMITISTQVVTTIAGTANRFGRSDGSGPAANFYNLNGMAIDASGNLYVADSDNNGVRKLTPTLKGSGKTAHTVYVTSTLAGTLAYAGVTDGSAATARFGLPNALAFDSSGNLWILDGGGANTVREITTAGQLTTVAGSGGVSGAADGAGAAASFNFSFFTSGGLTIAPNGNLYVTDYNNATVRQVTTTGVVTTIAGLAGALGSNDGTGNAAQFCQPSGITSDSQGNLYVADSCNDTIRVIAPGGVVTTLAGSPGVQGSSDGTGNTASFKNPTGIALGIDGNLYVSDTGNHTIRRVTLAGVVTTVAGNPATPGNSDGVGTAATFVAPTGMTVAPSGTLYLADSNFQTANLVRAFNPATGVVTTIAGTSSAPATFTAGVLPANLSQPRAVAVSGTSLYIATEDGIAVASNAVE